MSVTDATHKIAVIVKPGLLYWCVIRSSHNNVDNS